MSLDEETAAWTEASTHKWSLIPARLAKTLADSAIGSARDAVRGWELQLGTLAIATPLRVAVESKGLAPLVDRAVLEEEGTLSEHGVLSVSALGLLDLANALECVGIPLQTESWASMAGWVPRIRRSIHDDAYWTVRFAAVALDPTAHHAEEFAVALAQLDGP